MARANYRPPTTSHSPAQSSVRTSRGASRTESRRATPWAPASPGLGHRLIRNVFTPARVWLTYPTNGAHLSPAGAVIEYPMSPPPAAAGPPARADDQPDLVLVARASDGDRDSMERLLRRHYDAAFAVAFAIASERADAEDICHDALIWAAARLRACRDASRFRTWLCSIVRNHARNWLTRGANARRLDTLAPDLASGEDVAAQAERADLRDRLEIALRAIPEEMREVVLLHDLAGWTHEEIAGLMGMSAGNSRQKLFRGRHQLRALLRPSARED